MRGISRTGFYEVVRFMSVRLMLIIVVAYLQAIGVAYTKHSVISVLGPVETFVFFWGFVLNYVGETVCFSTDKVFAVPWAYWHCIYVNS